MRSVFYCLLFLMSACSHGGVTKPGAVSSDPTLTSPATSLNHYYAHDTVEDENGIIAPWYTGQNGQIDERVHIAIDVMKRYPWVNSGQPSSPLPEYVPGGTSNIAPDGSIQILPFQNHDNGDLTDRGSFALFGWIAYYQYSGDPAAFSHIQMIADYILDNCVTGVSDTWPGILISVPTAGAVYGRCDPHGLIQLDLVARFGRALLEAYEMNPNPRWLQAATLWGNLLVSHANLTDGSPLWPRYANPADIPSSWNTNKDKMTAGHVYVLDFLNELAVVTQAASNSQIQTVIQAGNQYVQNSLIAQWTQMDTFGLNFWDTEGEFLQGDIADEVANYILKHRDQFPNWRTDARNILTLVLSRASVDPANTSGVFSGAWQYPESQACCGKSLGYAPMYGGWSFEWYARAANDPLIAEMGKRMLTLATYDATPTGYAEDLIQGGIAVYSGWFKIAEIEVIKPLLETIGQQPELFAPPSENHLVHSASIVQNIDYHACDVQYTLFNASSGTDVLRLNFKPQSVSASDVTLQLRSDLKSSGYTVRDLLNGDYLIEVRHDGKPSVHLSAACSDPSLPGSDLISGLSGSWQMMSGSTWTTTSTGAKLQLNFEGNQIQVEGQLSSDGGLAEVTLDGQTLPGKIDFWNGAGIKTGIVWSMNGLANQAHTLVITSLGKANLRSSGNRVSLSSVTWSQKTPTQKNVPLAIPSQHIIFGRADRSDVVDSEGTVWRAGTEVLTPLNVSDSDRTACLQAVSGSCADGIQKTWWTSSTANPIEGTHSPEVYANGIHDRFFYIYETVSPGTYTAVLKFATTHDDSDLPASMQITINGRVVQSNFVPVLSANGLNKVYDLVVPNILADHGMVEIDFQSLGIKDAYVQALELLPSS